jgi:hypothetical protein
MQLKSSKCNFKQLLSNFQYINIYFSLCHISGCNFLLSVWALLCMSGISRLTRRRSIKVCRPLDLFPRAPIITRITVTFIPHIIRVYDAIFIQHIFFVFFVIISYLLEERHQTPKLQKCLSSAISSSMLLLLM